MFNNSFIGFVGLETHNLIILLSGKPVIGIPHWKYKTGHMHSTAGTGIVMGNKFQLTHLYCTISTGEFFFCLFCISLNTEPRHRD